MPGVRPMRHARRSLLIGARHDYQRPGAYGAEEFRAVVTAVCLERDIKALAEEMSTDGLAPYHTTESICEQVASALGIPHRYCDPSREQQLALGIADPGAEGDPVADAIRMRWWLECIQKT